MRVIYVLNGPELDRLGEREPEIYGPSTLAEVEEMCRKKAEALDAEIVFRQTDEESEMVAWISEACREGSGLVINPASFTHHSLDVRKAIAACSVPVVELHISNIHAREPWRSHSMVSGAANAVIVGLGVSGYPLAIEAVMTLER